MILLNEITILVFDVCVEVIAPRFNAIFEIRSGACEIVFLGGADYHCGLIRYQSVLYYDIG